MLSVLALGSLSPGRHLVVVFQCLVIKGSQTQLMKRSGNKFALDFILLSFLHSQLYTFYENSIHLSFFLTSK